MSTGSRGSRSIFCRNLLIYLQSAEPTAFGQGHSTTVQSPVYTLPANTTGYTCWDTTANRELFTMTFKDTTTNALRSYVSPSSKNRNFIDLNAF